MNVPYPFGDAVTRVKRSLCPVYPCFANGFFSPVVFANYVGLYLIDRIWVRTSTLQVFYTFLDSFLILFRLILARIVC